MTSLGVIRAVEKMAVASTAIDLIMVGGSKVLCRIQLQDSFKQKRNPQVLLLRKWIVVCQKSGEEHQ